MSERAPEMCWKAKHHCHRSLWDYSAATCMTVDLRSCVGVCTTAIPSCSSLLQRKCEWESSHSYTVTLGLVNQTQTMAAKEVETGDSDNEQEVSRHLLTTGDAFYFFFNSCACSLMQTCGYSWIALFFYKFVRIVGSWRRLIPTLILKRKKKKKSTISI